MSAMAAEGETMGEKGRCLKCSEWQEHCYWEHMDVRNIKFSKVMTADYRQRISIPENIANKFTGQIAKGAFTLKAPSGDKWSVHVEKMAGAFFFMSGWEEFAKAHELQENDLLFFTCSGHGSFDVFIFNSSGSEKVPCFFADKECANMRKHFEDIVGQQAEGHCRSAMAAEGETMGEMRRCLKCREWQEHYYWEHTDVSNIRFFKVMTADYQQRISIPENIANKFNGQIAKGAFTLKAPSGDTWRMDVGKIADEFFFMSGWEEFAKAHELQENDLLFFTCSGNGSFDVFIFDSSGSEKVPCFFADKEGANMRKQFDDMVGQQAEGHCLLSYSDNAIVPLPQPVESPHKASTSDKPGKEDESRNNGNSEVKGGVTEEEEQSDYAHIDSDCYYYSRFASYLNVDEQEQIFGLASIQPGNPVYVVVLQKAHVRAANNMLIIPSKFAADHLERKSHDMLLLRPNRKEQWYIKYHLAGTTRGFRGSRWAKFVRDNRLSEGDVCLFELIKGARKATMTVHVTQKVNDGQFVLLG